MFSHLVIFLRPFFYHILDLLNDDCLIVFKRRLCVFINRHLKINQSHFEFVFPPDCHEILEVWIQVSHALGMDIIQRLKCFAENLEKFINRFRLEVRKCSVQFFHHNKTFGTVFSVLVNNSYHVS